MADLYQGLLRPLLFHFDAETTHRLAVEAMKLADRLPAVKQTVADVCQYVHPALKCKCFGLEFPNPVGLAAGFDKNAELVAFWSALGFGSTELGTITALGQPGNPQPRLFRLPDDGGLINRMGFNNAGAAAVGQQLARQLSTRRAGIPIGINIGKSKLTPLENAAGDYLRSLQLLAGFADYLVINVSSPNTPGLRELQNRDQLDRLLAAVRPNCEDKPLLLKIAPELSREQLQDVVELARTHELDGLIATNTTVSRDGLRTRERSLVEQAGGLSGAPLRNRSTEVIRTLYRLTEGGLPIIGVGGIFSASDAYAKIRAGASLVQLYTGFIYGGPLIVKRLLRGLVELLERDGFATVGEAVGTLT